MTIETLVIANSPLQLIPYPSPLPILLSTLYHLIISRWKTTTVDEETDGLASPSARNKSILKESRVIVIR